MPPLAGEDILDAVVLVVGSEPNKMGTGFVFREHSGEI